MVPPEFGSSPRRSAPGRSARTPRRGGWPRRAGASGRGGPAGTFGAVLGVLAETLQQRLELRPLGRVDHVIGVEPIGVLADGPGQRGVAGRSEVVDPDEVEDPGAELPGDLDRPVGAAG